MLLKLIRSRYNNIHEYKQKIYAGPHGLPSYVSQVLKEMSFWSCGTSSNKFLMSNLTSGLPPPKSNHTNSELINDSMGQNGFSPSTINRMLHNLELLNAKIDQTQKGFDLNAYNSISNYGSNSDNMDDVVKTLNYLRLLQKSNKLNNHLDHDSFDEKAGGSSIYEVCFIILSILL